MGFFSLDAPTQNAAFGSAVGLSAEGGSLIVGAPNSNEGEVGAGEFSVHKRGSFGIYEQVGL